MVGVFCAAGLHATVAPNANAIASVAMFLLIQAGKTNAYKKLLIYHIEVTTNRKIYIVAALKIN